MVATGCAFSSIADGDPYFTGLLEAAFERGLAVVLENRPGLPRDRWEPALYAMHLDQTWRIPALNALWETAFVEDGRWSRSAEAQHSLLLGYTAKQRKDWIAWRRQQKAAETCLDLYVMLTAQQRTTAKALGMRCFGTPEQMEGMTFFFPRNGTEPKATASKLVPKGQTFARVGLSWAATKQLFGEFATWKRAWMSVKIARAQAPFINEGLKSNVQIMTARGWK